MTSTGYSPDASTALPAVRRVSLGRPLRWLLLGWRDFTRAVLPSAAHGLAAALGGLAILGIAWGHFHLLSGAFSGFLLVGPLLATGLYELSRRLSAGEPANFAAALAAWKRGGRPLLSLGLLLMLAGTFWVLVSAVLIALFVKAPITGMESFVRHVVIAEDSNLFLIWVGLGGLLASLVFAATVVAVPLLLDRDVGMPTAMLASVQAVAENPLPMAFWAALIMLLTLIGMAPLLLGLVLAIPVLGHASWHAYSDLVDASGLPPRR